MLNAILSTARKDLLLMAKDPAALAILFAMPLVFIVVMSLAMARVYEPSAAALRVAIADEDHGAFAGEFISQLKATGGFELVTEEAGRPYDRATVEARVAAGRLQVAVIIPAGLSAALLEALTGPTQSVREILLITDPALSPQIVGPLRGALKGLSQQAAFQSVASPGIDQLATRSKAMGGNVPEAFTRDLKERANQARTGGSSLVSVREVVPTASGRVRRPNSVEQNVPAYTLLALFFIAMQLATNIQEERRLGTFRRLLAAPVARWALMAGKVAAFVAINLVQVAVMFAIGVFVLPRFGAPSMTFGAHPEALVLVTLAVALAANALGLLLAALARNQARSTGLGLMLVLTSAMLGGVMVPRFVMPPVMQTIGLASPHTWGLNAYQDVLIRGADTLAILPATGVLLAFAAVMFTFAVWRFRWD